MISDKSLLRDKVYFAYLQTCIIYRNMYRRILRTLDWLFKINNLLNMERCLL